MQNGESDSNGRTPPYGAWGTWISTLDHFNAVGIPNLVDRKALPGTLSGGSAYEMLGALKYFALVDDDSRPNLEHIAGSL